MIFISFVYAVLSNVSDCIFPIHLSHQHQQPYKKQNNFWYSPKNLKLVPLNFFYSEISLATKYLSKKHYSHQIVILSLQKNVLLFPLFLGSSHNKRYVNFFWPTFIFSRSPINKMIFSFFWPPLFFCHYINSFWAAT